MKKLSQCGICCLPSILLEMPKLSKAKNFFKKPWKEAQGPTTNKRVKKWCSGTCYGLLIPLWVEIDELSKIETSTKNIGVRKLANIMKKRLNSLCKEQTRKIAELMQRV